MVDDSLKSAIPVPEFPLEDRERVFDRFYRRGQANGPGSGLGLAIVKTIADRHQAQVVLDDSRLGGLRARWRKRVKNDWLRLKLAGKDDKSIRETLAKRYELALTHAGRSKSDDVFQLFMNAYASRSSRTPATSVRARPKTSPSR
jgi:hypothetical protein